MDYLEFELYHHGILGMKWGVRRYQNEDGSLTAAGEARYRKIAASERLTRRENRTARDILKEQLKYENARAVGNAKASERYKRKAEKAEKKGDAEKSSQYISKAKLYNVSSMFADMRARNLSTEISKINDGTLKAGRDFITQTDWNIYPLGFVTYVNIQRQYMPHPSKPNSEYRKKHPVK